MIRNLLATTAIVTIAASGAYAAEHTAPKAETPAMMDHQAAGKFMSEMGDAALASELIGETVYASEAEDAEAIGEINDLLVATAGDIDAAIIGVGGFLGIGEKNVAVSFDDLKFVTRNNGEDYVVLAVSKEELESAPDFQIRTDVTPDTAANDPNSPPKPADTAMAPAEPTTGMTAADPETVNPAAPTAGAAEPRTQRDTLKTVDVGTISSDNVIGATVYSSDDKNVGDIGEVVLTDDGKIDAVVIDVGGFLGIGEKPVAIAFQDLEFRSDENGNLYVYTKFTKDQLDAATEYVKDEYKQKRDVMLLRTAG